MAFGSCKFMLAATVCLTFASFPVLADETSASGETGLVFDTSIGIMNGLAQEFVYNPDGSELSRLDWRMDNILMFQGGVALNVTNRARAGLRGAFSLTGASNMDDYDFNVGFCPPAPGGGRECHSSHPDTQLRQAWMLDLYGEYDVIKRDDFSLSLIGGYKRDHYEWSAIGGTANYATLPPGFGISYEQNWSAPYVGVGFQAKRGNGTFTGRLTGSVWASGDDMDDHHLRNLLFTESFDRTTYLSADLGYKHQLRQGMSLTAGYRYQQWGTGKGPTVIYNRFRDQTTTIPGDSAGANSISHTISFGLTIATDGLGAPVAEEGDGAGWSGIYAGLNMGILSLSQGFSTFDVASGDSPDPLTANSRLDAFGQSASAFAGWQSNGSKFFWGVEGDLGRSNANEWAHGIPGVGNDIYMRATSDSTAFSHGWEGSLRLRLGADVTPRLNVYATGGIAFGQVNVAVSCPANFTSWCVVPNYEEVSKVAVGWTAGAGADWDLGNNWFTRAEYRFTDLGTFSHKFFESEPFDAVEADITSRSHKLNFGLGYRF